MENKMKILNCINQVTNVIKIYILKTLLKFIEITQINYFFKRDNINQIYTYYNKFQVKLIIHQMFYNCMMYLSKFCFEQVNFQKGNIVKISLNIK
jgi:hypothetical protein